MHQETHAPVTSNESTDLGKSQEFQTNPEIQKSISNEKIDLTVKNLILRKIKKYIDPHAKSSKRMSQVAEAVQRIKQDEIEKQLYDELLQVKNNQFYNQALSFRIKQIVSKVLIDLESNLSVHEGAGLYVIEDYYLNSKTKIPTLYQYLREYLSPYWKTQRKTNIWNKISNYLNGHW